MLKLSKGVVIDCEDLEIRFKNVSLWRGLKDCK